jgi:SAM-dependent methyltransferase
MRLRLCLRWRREIRKALTMNSSETLGEIYARQACWFQAERSRLLRRVNITAKKHVLDLGAGTGEILRELSRRCDGFVAGLDLDPTSLNLATGNRIAGDAHSLPFPDRSFDLIFTQMFFLWVKDPITVIREIFRVLDDNSSLIIAAEPDYGGLIEHPPTFSQTKAYAESLKAEGADIQVARKLGRLLSDNGFRVEAGSHCSAPLESAKQDALYTTSEAKPDFLHVPYFWFFAIKR